MTTYKNTILIVSCDKYADAWDPFFSCMQKYWDTSNYNVYLSTNQLTYENKYVRSIRTGYDKSWSDNLKIALDEIDDDYVLLLLEDFFITKKVNTRNINELFDICRKRNVACLRISPLPYPTPAPRTVVSYSRHLGIPDLHTDYRVNLQPAIWKKSYLLKLLVSKQSAWEFEHESSILSNYHYVTILQSLKSNLEYTQGIEKGKWNPAIIEFLKENCPNGNFTARPIFVKEDLDEHMRRPILDSVINKKEIFKLCAEENRKGIIKYLWRTRVSEGTSIILGLIGFIKPAWLLHLRKLNIMRKQKMRSLGFKTKW